MRSKFLVLAGVVIAVTVLGFVSSGQTKTGLPAQETMSENTVSITMSASRPGCENTECYSPSKLAIHTGDTVTWVNNDRGFHTVTTGYYDTPDGMIESHQLEATEKFSYKFDELGEFHYYCRLHPWMEGTIIVS